MQSGTASSERRAYSGDMTAAPASQSRAILRDLLIVASVGAAIWVAHRLGRIVLVLVLAMFFAYVIAPLVDLAAASGLPPGTLAASVARASRSPSST